MGTRSHRAPIRLGRRRARGFRPRVRNSNAASVAEGGRSPLQTAHVEPASHALTKSKSAEKTAFRQPGYLSFLLMARYSRQRVIGSRSWAAVSGKGAHGLSHVRGLAGENLGAVLKVDRGAL